MPLRFGSKLILIYLVSLCLALGAVMISAQSIISHQIQRRHQKKLEALTQSVFFQLDKKKDEIRLIARAMANLGQMGYLVEQLEVGQIRRLVRPVFQDSGLDVLYIAGNTGQLLSQFQTDRFTAMGKKDISLVRKAILGDYRMRLSRWEQGIFLTGSSPIYQEDHVAGQVFAGLLIGNDFIRGLATDSDAFLAIINEGKVLASTLSGKEKEDEELEFSDELLQDIKALKGQPLPVYVEETMYTMKSQPLKDKSGNLLGFLVIGLSRNELNQTAGSLQRTILVIGLVSGLLGILLTVLLTYRMRKQIQLLAGGTRKISAGFLSEKIPVTSGDELGALAASFNQMSRTLEERNQVLEKEKEKILANVDFLSMMVHDVKAPLTGVHLMLEILLEDSPGAEFTQRLLGLRESVEELLAHLQNVLSITQIEKGPFTLKEEEVQLNTVVPLVRSQCQIIAESKKIRWLEDLAPDLPPVRGDEFYLERLLYNLLINALHWAPRGGWVKITTRVRQRETAGRVVLEVTDNGPGISPEQKPFLFQQFGLSREKGKAVAAHSGLGLYIAQIIAKAHGGLIEEQGREGEGARFLLSLPRPNPE
ncbi:MAG: HAMP domain-containing protein [Deltaproteobacteria bacterium]|nr:HAMP domain-containing protein [Deltaproteobacteria bacterium]